MMMRVPILGQVAAGRPVDFIPIRSWREIRPVRGAHWRKRYAGLTVIGDSMIEENIFDGDIVIFEMTHEAREGDLVVALTPLGLTVKRLHRDGNRVVLQPANASHEAQIWDADDVIVQGVVRRVVRDL